MAHPRATARADLSRLNPQQRSVVTTVDVGCCVVSIPGSGKTATVTEKIVHLLTGHLAGEWVRPKSVMAVTFTAEAGKELTERTKKRLGRSSVQPPSTGTFHSLFMQSLRRIGSAMTARRLASPGQAAQYVDRALETATQGGFENYNMETKDLFRQLFERARCNIHDPFGLANAHTPEALHRASIVEKALNDYQERMKRAALMDFGMILEESLRFLKSKGKEVERTRDYLQAKSQREANLGYSIEWADEYREFLGGATHLIVDEAQDIDDIQLEIIVAISNEHVIVDIVGDDDQSIYRFRNGLGYQGMMEFTRRTGATLILMENNYRCRQEILSLAGEVISHNTQRNQKTLFAHRGRGGTVTLSEFKEGETELEFVAQSIKALRKQQGGNTTSAAVIARLNSTLDVVQLALTRQGIPNARMGGSSIWGDAPVCFLTAYLQGLLRRGDPAAVDQCLYWAGVRHAIGSQSDRDGALVVSLTKIASDSKARAWSSNPNDVKRVVSDIHGWFCRAVVDSDWSDKRKDFNIDRLRIASEMLAGTDAYLAGEREIQQLARPSGAKMPTRQGLTGTLSERLQALQRLDRTGKEDPTAVKIVSMHGSKGLEFEYCWIVALDDKTIPNLPTIPEEPCEEAAEVLAALEEERRLLYVAMTRAKDELHMSWSHKPIHRPRARTMTYECRFLTALPKALRPQSIAPDHDIDRKAGFTV